MRDQLAAFLADNPETFSLTITALVCLAPNTIPRVDIFLVPIDLCLGTFRHSTNHSLLS